MLGCIFMYLNMPKYLHFYCYRILLLEQCFTCTLMQRLLHLLLKCLCDETNLQRCVQNTVLNQILG